MSEQAGHPEKAGQPGHWFRREWRLVVGLSLSAFCLALAAREISIEDLETAVSVARWEWVALAMGVVVASSSLKAVRWRVLFFPRRIPLGRTWSVFMIGQMLNILLPARAGEVGRIYLIGDEDAVSHASALSTVVVEKVVDLVMLTLAFLIVALWLATTATRFPDWLEDAGMGLVLLAVMGLAAILLLARLGHRIWRLLRRALKPAPPRWIALADSAAEQAISALGSLQHSQARIQIWSWSILIWLLMALTNALVFSAFDLELSPYVALLLLVVLMGGVALPPLPGNLGVFVFLCILVLSLFDVNRETALIYGITLQIVAFLPLIAIGLACMFWENWHVRRSSPKSESTEGFDLSVGQMPLEQGLGPSAHDVGMAADKPESTSVDTAVDYPVQ